MNWKIVLGPQAGIEIVSISTKSSAERLGRAVGKAAYALATASNAMVAVN